MFKTISHRHRQSETNVYKYTFQALAYLPVFPGYHGNGGPLDQGPSDLQDTQLCYECMAIEAIFNNEDNDTILVIKEQISINILLKKIA